MAVLDRPKKHPTKTSPSDSGIIRSSLREAPDAGAFAEDDEAPEFRPGRSAEAPDAGEGRSGLMELEFTHGRSQS